MLNNPKKDIYAYFHENILISNSWSTKSTSVEVEAFTIMEALGRNIFIHNRNSHLRKAFAWAIFFLLCKDLGISQWTSCHRELTDAYWVKVETSQEAQIGTFHINYGQNICCNERYSTSFPVFDIGLITLLTHLLPPFEVS